MTAILRRLAFGLYQLPTGWKRDADRRLNLSAILATMLAVNLNSARVLVQEFVVPEGSFGEVSNAVLVIIVVVFWAVLHNIVITGPVYSDIEARSLTDPLRTRARSFFVIYLFATILLIVLALVVAATK